MLTNSVYAQNTRDNLVFTVDRDYWEGCETGEGICEPLTFERNSINDSIELVMPCGGTFTTVHLTYNDETIETVEVDAMDCPPKFDLTGMKDGEYGAYMQACGLGGPIKFRIITKRKK